MIFTSCVNCDEAIVYPYEAGDDPCGLGVFDRVVCKKCKTPNFIERTSFGGSTLSEKEFKKEAVKHGGYKKINNK